MNRCDMGEFGFIEKIKTLFKAINSGKYEGIGDDCSVIPISDKSSLVITTDMLVENIHFIKDRISPFDLGYKSLAVNLSDVASMGAKPICTFMSIAVDSSVTNSYLDEFLSGYYSLSKQFSVELLGGDTTSSQSGLVINVTAVGIVDNCDIKRRSMAKVGDSICVVSNLGDSGCGLQLLLQGIYDENSSNHNFLVAQHHHPKPFIDEGIWLAQNGIGAMMDISDGIASDLGHICKASNVGSNVNVDSLPLSKQACCVMYENGWNRAKMALCSGEDYSLLFTVDSDNFDELSYNFKEEFGTDIYKIGEIIEGDNIRYFDKNGDRVDVEKGFTHF